MVRTGPASEQGRIPDGTTGGPGAPPRATFSHSHTENPVSEATGHLPVQRLEDKRSHWEIAKTQFLEGLVARPAAARLAVPPAGWLTPGRWLE